MFIYNSPSCAVSFRRSPIHFNSCSLLRRHHVHHGHLSRLSTAYVVDILRSCPINVVLSPCAVFVLFSSSRYFHLYKIGLTLSISLVSVVLLCICITFRNIEFSRLLQTVTDFVLVLILPTNAVGQCGLDTSPTHLRFPKNGRYIADL